MNRIPVEAILTACATGGRMLKTEYADLLGEEKLFHAPVRDFSEYIAEKCKLEAPAHTQRLTFHDPCHLKWGQGVTDPPRAIMRARSDFVEAPDADRCCGFGGIFSMFHYDLGTQIFQRKEEFLKSDVKGIVTACPGCMLQLSDQMEQIGDQRPVIHLAQLLDDEPPKTHPSK
jgi:glycolate oxidase iron-sulfur subunit